MPLTQLTELGDSIRFKPRDVRNFKRELIRAVDAQRYIEKHGTKNIPDYLFNDVRERVESLGTRQRVTRETPQADSPHKRQRQEVIP